MKVGNKSLLLVFTLFFVLQISAQANEVNVYSYRKPQLIQPMFDEFTAQTGIKINAVFAKKGMLERLKSEGQNSPADIVFTTDIGRLTDFKNAELTQAITSDLINGNIPSNLRDPENHWFGLTSRARILVLAKDRVPDGELVTYEDLADPKWKGRVCTRSGKHPYNIALISMMMAHHGSESAETWLSGVKSNLARKPEGNDRGQVKAIREGLCDVAVINHYYMYQMVSDPEQKPWADAVKVIFPNQSDRGTHMNISGMAMTRHAPNAENARKLMEFLASNKAQAMYAEVNGEYPVNQGISLSEYLQSLGSFKRDDLDLSHVATFRAEASKMVDRVAYND
ncbi:MAG: Fe(3+) ABC transporter substrate-binding protein [bacterium]